MTDTEEITFEPDQQLLDSVRRAGNLLELGFIPEQIDRMCPWRNTFDWHAAEKLLDEGKTHEQVSWLLEPLE